MDSNDTISYQELELFFIASCRGLSKLLRISIPEDEKLKDIAYTLFYRYDLDKSNSLEFEEYL